MVPPPSSKQVATLLCLFWMASTYRHIHEASGRGVIISPKHDTHTRKRDGRRTFKFAAANR